jgi:hypothetical protein
MVVTGPIVARMGLGVQLTRACCVGLGGDGNGGVRVEQSSAALVKRLACHLNPGEMALDLLGDAGASVNGRKNAISV